MIQFVPPSPPPHPHLPFPSGFVPPWGGGEGGHFQATKAGLGQQALMFILADCSPYCLAFFCVCPGTTSPPPRLTENNPPEAFFCAWPRVRGCPVLKPLTHKRSSIPSPLFPPFLLPQLYTPFYLRFTFASSWTPHIHQEHNPVCALRSESRERNSVVCELVIVFTPMSLSPTSESPADQSLIQNMISHH